MADEYQALIGFTLITSIIAFIISLVAYKNSQKAMSGFYKTKDINKYSQITSDVLFGEIIRTAGFLQYHCMYYFNIYALIKNDKGIMHKHILYSSDAEFDTMVEVKDKMNDILEEYKTAYRVVEEKELKDKLK